MRRPSEFSGFLVSARFAAPDVRCGSLDVFMRDENNEKVADVPSAAQTVRSDVGVHDQSTANFAAHQFAGSVDRLPQWNFAGDVFQKRTTQILCKTLPRR